MAELAGQILDIANDLRPLSLGQIEELALMDRVDVKFILHERDFLPAFAASAHMYDVLDVIGVRGGRYFTTYFDTPKLDMYQMHHNGARVRYKVRTRWYVDSAAIFLEVKEKNNRERTRKTRIPLQEPITDLHNVRLDWLPERFAHDPHSLRPTVWNRFRRLMLADMGRRERITVDLGIHFGDDNRVVDLPGLVVVEIKQHKFSLASPLARQIHAIHKTPYHISKYCVAMATLHPEIKTNQFKPILRRLEKICDTRLQ